MTQAQDDAYALVAKNYTTGTTRPSQTAYGVFRSQTLAWLTARSPAPPPSPVPVLTPANFTLVAGYGLDALVGEVDIGATNTPTSFEIVDGNTNNYFSIYNATGNIRTSPVIPVPPGNYSLGIRGLNANGPGPAATFGIVAQGVITPPPPPVTGWPDASNTGVPVGTILAPSGGMTISTAGTVVSGKSFTGPVVITANNVTLEKCKIATSSWYVVQCRGVTGTIVQDCEIDAKGLAGSNGIDGVGTFRRNNIHDCENGINTVGNNGLIEDNYIHNLRAGGSPHYDGIQMDGNCANWVIRHNRIDNNNDGAGVVMIDNYFGPISNILVDSNWLSGGGYMLYSDGQFSGGSITGVKVTNNKMGKGGWGYFAINNNTVVKTGNYDAITGAPVS